MGLLDSESSDKSRYFLSIAFGFSEKQQNKIDQEDDARIDQYISTPLESKYFSQKRQCLRK